MQSKRQHLNISACSRFLFGNREFFFLLFFVFLLETLTANVLLVPQDFASIQTAIDSAQTGDTVLVVPGIYQENLQIRNKDITLASNYLYSNSFVDVEATVLDGRRLSAVMQVFVRNKSKITGFKIINGDHFYGGGFVSDVSSPVITACIFENNYAQATGGAFYAEEGQPVLRKCLFIRNTSGAFGGAIASGYTEITVDHCTFYGNTSGDGGAVSCFQSSIPISNSIFLENFPEAISVWSGVTTAMFSNVQGGWDGEGNINADPLFCNADSNDFYLAANSPCIGTGQNGSDMGALSGACAPNAVVDEQVLIPGGLTLLGAFPNPFNPVTRIVFNLPEGGAVDFEVFDTRGGRVYGPVSAVLKTGRNSVLWRAKNLGTGQYFYRIQTANGALTGRLVLLK